MCITSKISIWESIYCCKLKWTIKNKDFTRNPTAGCNFQTHDECRTTADYSLDFLVWSPDWILRIRFHCSNSLFNSLFLARIRTTFLFRAMLLAPMEWRTLAMSSSLLVCVMLCAQLVLVLSSSTPAGLWSSCWEPSLTSSSLYCSWGGIPIRSR